MIQTQPTSLADFHIRKHWSELDTEFQQCAKRLQRNSEQVDIETEAMRRPMYDEKRQQRMTGLLENLNVRTNLDAQVNLPCVYMPLTLDDRLSRRPKLEEKIAEILDPVHDDRPLSTLR